MENWTPIIDAETVSSSKYNDDVARLHNKIYSLRSKLTEQEQQNKKCHQMRLKFIYEQFEVLRERDKEIESLRQQLATERGRTDIDLVNNPSAWDRLDKALKERDEFKEECKRLIHEVNFERQRAEALRKTARGTE